MTVNQISEYINGQIGSECTFNYAHSEHPEGIYQNVEEAMGHVPIIRLNKFLSVYSPHSVYVKLEGRNPGGSIKDKNAAYLVQKAEELGLLKAGGTIIESSSGNLGIGLAMIGAMKGYKVIIVIDAKTSSMMRNTLKAFGAELVELDLAHSDEFGSMQIARMEKAQELTLAIPGAWYACQHLSPLTPHAHFYTTGPEIKKSFPEGVDYVVVGVSTGGQLAGISNFLRSEFPKTKIIAVDVKGSAVFGHNRSPYKMTGLGLSFTPPAFDRKLLDMAFEVDDQISFSICHQVAKSEGLLLGASTGALLAAVKSISHKLKFPSRILVVSPDCGERYLDTVYSQDWLAKNSIELLTPSDLDLKIEQLEPTLGK